ncbi:MAG: hypothetical protein Q8914_08205, partial [Bacteroidota bacterium]|nr:hypothetical protein [Bacteroidota bacterium]
EASLRSSEDENSGRLSPPCFLNAFFHSRRSLPVPASLPDPFHQPTNQLILFQGNSTSFQVDPFFCYNYKK